MQKTSIIYLFLITVSVGFFPSFLNVYATSQEGDDWETFKKSEYKFSIDYPKDLEVHDYFDGHPPGVMFYNFDSKYQIATAIFNVNPNNMTLTDFIDKKFSNNDLVKKVGEPIPITVDGVSGYSYSSKTTFGGGISKEAVFAYDNYIYHLIIAGAEEAVEDSLFSHMVNSIKFLK